MQRKIIIFALICLIDIGCSNRIVQMIEKNDIWIPKDLIWVKSSEDTTESPYAENSMVIYFEKSGYFKFIVYPLYKVNVDRIAMGSDGVIYRGKWSSIGDAVIVRYKMTYRSLPIVGEEIPKDEIVDTIHVITNDGVKNELIFRNEVFMPYREFDESIQEFIRPRL